MRIEKNKINKQKVEVIMKVKKMYHICMVDRSFRALIDVKGKPNKYGKPKVFETKEAAEMWIKKHSYKGMSWEYEICEDN